MESRQQTTEESSGRAVSPVIGVILMVAITVILAAVIAAFVLDIGPGDPEPNAAVDVSGDSDGFDLELISLDNADGVVVVDGSSDDSSILGAEETDTTVLTTAGQVEEFDEGVGSDTTIQAVRFDGDDVDDEEVGEETTANAIIENID